MNSIITILGFGNIGREICFSLLNFDDNFTINIIDPSDEIDGSLKDMIQAMGFNSNHSITINNSDLFNASHYVFHCAGANVPIDASRLSIVKESVEITEIAFEKYRPNPEAKIIVVSNPVEIISFITKQITGLPSKNVIGTGTSLDSIRMNYLSKMKYPHLKNPNFILLGEHGHHIILDKDRSSLDSNIAHNILSEHQIDELLGDVKKCARAIKKTQGFTLYGPVMSSLKVFRCLFKNETCFFPVSTEIPQFTQNRYGFKPIFLSLYAELNSNGTQVRMENFDFNKLKSSYSALLEAIPDKYLG